MPVARSFRSAVVLMIFSQVVYGFHFNSGMETLLFSSLVLLAVCCYVRDSQGAPERTGRRPGLRIRHDRVPDASQGSDPRRLDRPLVAGVDIHYRHNGQIVGGVSGRRVPAGPGK